MEGPVASPGANSIPSSNPFPAIDPALLVEYLRELLSVTLGASREDLEGPGSLLSKSRYSDTVQRCTRFATESQLVLYIQKDILDEADGIDGPLQDGAG